LFSKQGIEEMLRAELDGRVWLFQTFKKEKGNNSGQQSQWFFQKTIAATENAGEVISNIPVI
jgi:hypothetical protein